MSVDESLLHQSHLGDRKLESFSLNSWSQVRNLRWRVLNKTPFGARACTASGPSEAQCSSLIQSFICLQHTIHPDVFAAQPQSGTKAPEFTREVTSPVLFVRLLEGCCNRRFPVWLRVTLWSVFVRYTCPKRMQERMVLKFLPYDTSHNVSSLITCRACCWATASTRTARSQRPCWTTMCGLWTARTCSIVLIRCLPA
jgi:hypothetical protein